MPEEFIKQLNSIEGINIIILNDEKYLKLTPSSSLSINFHHHEKQSNDTDANKIDFILANMQGIITNKKNKCKSIRNLTMSNNGSQIIGLTETWAKDNFNSTSRIITF